MYLKQLDILGFKSFANRTAIRFSPGITAIVGPNGCGKTNILDALRWVLGEQKISLLRGAKMEEVIFNGTREVKPLGMAEVTLNVVNNRGVLPTEYTEVQVTRRLFRSGESEYLLNKVPCRRKDIMDLFVDTGMGAHSYSVIQQDMIDSVISDKAEERRFLFEEAAGITKYKQRKAAAMRKLDATEQDLLRLRDIYTEVVSQVRSLNRQQKKAQRYQKILDDIKAWELFLSSTRLRDIERQKRELKGQLDELSARRLAHQTTVDTIRAKLEADRTEQVQLERSLSAISGEIYELSEEAHSQEREISILVEKRSGNRQLIERNENDIQALEARSQLIVEQMEETSHQLERKRQEGDELAGRLAQAEAVQGEADRSLLAVRSGRDRENQELLQLEGKLSSGKTEEQSLARQEQDLKDHQSELEQEAQRNSERLKDLQERLSRHSSAQEELVRRRLESEARRSELRRKIEEGSARSEELSERTSDLSASLEAAQARRCLLEEMIVHYEGFSSGVVAVMERRDDFPGLIGTVAEKFLPREGYEEAVEAALGEMAGFVLCRDRVTAERIVAFLKEHKKGRCGILVPDTGTLNPVVKRPEMDQPGFVGWLDQLVQVEDELKPLMQAVLARTAAFEAGIDPSSILQHLPFGFTAVSTDGTVYSKNLISGGSEDKLPLLNRRERINQLDRDIEQMENELSEMRRRRDSLTAELAQWRAESAELSRKLDDLSEEISNARQETGQLQAQVESARAEQTRLEKEVQQTGQRLEQIRSRQYTLGLDYSELSSRKNTLVSNLSEAECRLEVVERQAVEAAEEVGRLQVRMVETRSQVDQIESKISHLTELRKEIDHSIEAKKSENEDAAKQIRQSADKIEQIEAALKQVFADRSKANERQTSLRAKQGEIQQRVNQLEEQLQQARNEKDTISEKTHQLEIRLNTFSSESQSLMERIREEYDIDLSSIEPERPDEGKTDEEAREHLVRQKEKLKKFGAVNLLALEEHKTAVEREEFLREQLDDLTQAKDDLQSTIRQINRRARQMFNETFAQVRQNFQKLFVQLFTGGEADISLEEPDNPLESDIVIMARPRGKKLLSITMMSGGERALTAIALLFSLYLVKPSPFCILDEIDAPLDDANCRRFLNIIRGFADQTQFIIITHNKITMSTADNLYGVTMEQAGISKLVAVRFTDVRKSASGELVIVDHTSPEEAAQADNAVDSATDMIDVVADEEEDEREALTRVSSADSEHGISNDHLTDN